jgi:hypothetical protein
MGANILCVGGGGGGPMQISRHIIAIILYLRAFGKRKTCFKCCNLEGSV